MRAGEDVQLLLRASWQPERDRPALLLVHGLEGSDRSSYVLATGLYAWRRGWHVVRMNMRGAGDSESICPRLYNAGLDKDLVAAVTAVAKRVPRVGLAGFSLGGNLVLLALSRSREHIPSAVFGAATVSAPLDLAACSRALARPENWIYERHFMSELRATYRRRQGSRPDLYAAGRERGARTIREYDSLITAPYGGYASADEYYRESSAGPRLRSIQHPCLLLSAVDDPMIPPETIARWPVPENVEREVLATGGHVGFVAPTPVPGRFWAAERLLAFLEAL